MKKTYINPEITVVKIATSQMLAASMTISSETTNSFDSRKGYFDDEDEE